MVETACKAVPSIVQQLPDVFCQGLFQQLRFTLDTFTKEVVTPNEAEREAKRELFNCFAEFLRRAMQDRIAIAVAGSTAYEVDAKNSDLDVVLLTSWGAPNYVLQSVVHYLTMTQAVQTRNINWPLSARVPVLIVTTPGGLVCDVSVNTVNSIKHTEYFKRVLASTPHLRPFLRLVKYWTKARRLPATREGGLPGILWMILGCTYGSCPMAAFHKLCSQSSRSHHKDAIQRVLPCLDVAVPIFAKLFRFFYLCSSRELMSRNISSSQKVCYSKQKSEVAARVASATNYYGVWDEVVSIEDPSGCGEPEPPGNTVWVDDGKTSGNFAHALEPGSAKDLASKASAATWLVYLLELRRANVLTCKVIQFIDESRRRVRKLPQVLHHQNESTKSRRVRMLGSDAGAAPTTGGHDFVARTFRRLISALFKETIPDRYLLPGCDEQLRKVIEAENKDDKCSAIDLEWGADKVNARGPSHSKLHPFCYCCSKATTDFALILCHGRIHLVKMTSICTDWSTWWTRTFLSRRDSRSVVHGTLYAVLTPQQYRSKLSKSVPFPPTEDESTVSRMTTWSPIDDTSFREVVLPPTHFPKLGSGLDYYSSLFDDTTRSAMPYMLVPVRKQADYTPVEVLFHPCHFICRLRGWQIYDEDKGPPPSTPPEVVVAKEVFYAESDEVNFIRELCSICEEAPWYEPAANDPTFQPPAVECTRCGIDGESLVDLEGYDVTAGPIQDVDVKELVCQASWARWQSHAHRTRAHHASLLSERIRARQEADDAEKPPHIVPELSKATELLASTVENLNQSRRTSAPSLRRSHSTPVAVGTRRSLKDLL